jgi:hypothetical protein
MGVPQIAIADEFYTKYAPFQCTVPWRDFVYHVESEDAVIQDAREVMIKAVAEALPRREQMKEMQDSFMDDLLWTSPGSLAANNLLVEVAKRCLPPASWRASSMYRKARAAIDAHGCMLTSPPSEAELMHDEQKAHMGPMANRTRLHGLRGRGMEQKGERGDHVPVRAPKPKSMPPLPPPPPGDHDGKVHAAPGLESAHPRTWAQWLDGIFFVPKASGDHGQDHERYQQKEK